ncbi:MAG: DUF3021 domain-containing protein [Treponema sp.]|nr:DUF3021 domain-containing protein [Candidatus Treponema caballi]
MIGVFIGETMLIINSLLAGKGVFYPINPLLISGNGAQLSLVVIQYIMTGIIGMTFAASSVIFEMENWGLLRQTAVHFIITSVVMYICGFICNWFPHNFKSTAIWFGVFIIIYLLFWTGFTIYYRVVIRKINDAM